MEQHAVVRQSGLTNADALTLNETTEEDIRPYRLYKAIKVEPSDRFHPSGEDACTILKPDKGAPAFIQSTLRKIYIPLVP